MSSQLPVLNHRGKVPLGPEMCNLEPWTERIPELCCGMR